MTTYVFRKGGIPALASSSTLSSCLGSLIVQVSETSKQASVEFRLQYSIPNSRSNQQISLVYDADNLEPGTTTVRDATVSAAQMAQIARRGGANLKSLHMVLRDPCVVLVPSAESLPLEESSNDSLKQLVELAKATRLDIIFDSAWLHPNKAAQFHCLVGCEGLTGFPRHHGKTLREADWTVFSPSGAPPTEHPPAYEEASLKRPRQSSLSSLRASTPKRLLLDPDNNIDFGSPTEKATTTTAVSTPWLDPSSPSTDPFDPIKDATETALAKLLPQALRQILPEVLPDILPAILTRMFTVPPSIRSPDRTSATPNPLSPLHRLIRSQLNHRAEELAQQITLDTHSHALYLREIADVELDERLDDHRNELTALKEDGLMEIHRVYDTKLEQLEERTTELVNAVDQETSERYTTVKEKLDDYVSEQRLALVKATLDVQRRSRRGSFASKPVRRANSVPLDMG